MVFRVGGVEGGQLDMELDDLLTCSLATSTTLGRLSPIGDCMSNIAAGRSP